MSIIPRIERGRLYFQVTEVLSHILGRAAKARYAPVALDGFAMKAATVDPGRLKAPVGAELGHLHKTHALLIAVQFAANHEAKFDVSDALAVIRDRVEQSIARLDAAEVRP